MIDKVNLRELIADISKLVAIDNEELIQLIPSKGFISRDKYGIGFKINKPTTLKLAMLKTTSIMILLFYLLNIIYSCSTANPRLDAAWLKIKLEQKAIDF